MQAVWCLKFWNVTKSGGQFALASSPLEILRGLVPRWYIRTCGDAKCKTTASTTNNCRRHDASSIHELATVPPEISVSQLHRVCLRRVPALSAYYPCIEIHLTSRKNVSGSSSSARHVATRQHLMWDNVW